eukprot:UN22624
MYFKYVQTEKRTVVAPSYFSIISSMTPICASIAFQICSILNSFQVEKTSFTNPPFVHRLGFRSQKFAFQ